MAELAKEKEKSEYGAFKEQFRKRAFLTSMLFISVIIIGILLYKIHGMERLETVRQIDVVTDLFGMIMGYVIFICCVIDVQKVGKRLNYFLALLLLDFMAMFVDECAWLVDGIPSLSVWNVVANLCLFCTTPLLTFVFWRYTMAVLDVDLEKVKKWDWGIFFGLLVDLAVILSNPVTHVFFSVGEDGVYERSALHPLSYLYVYVVLFISLTFIYQKRSKLRRVQIVALFLYVLTPMLVGISSAFFYGVSLTGASIMMIILLMYCIFNVIQGREQMVADRDLAMAASIQENMLPNIFPPYPDRKEFDLYASMTPAKEVGGDFYDFFWIDEDHLAMVIADVSGKGIPAALFMMVSKVLIKNQAMAAGSDNVGKIFATVNEQLCEGNKVEMFVTAWLGILTISTGELRYANAGHEYPLIKRKGGNFEVVKEKHSPPLATMEGIRFREYSMKLEPGDVIFTYTDGVTEATDHKLELFGMDRMVDALNLNGESDPEKLDAQLRAKIGGFVGKAPQFDDVTTLCMRYNGTD